MLWRKFAGQPDEYFKEDSVICSLHFEKRFIIEFNGFVHLSTEAFPSIRRGISGQGRYFERVKPIDPIEHQQKHCRFCFEKTHKFYSLEDLNSIGIDVEHILKSLQLQLNLQKDVMPQFLCTACFDFINLFWEFKIKCNNVESEILAQHKLEESLYEELIVKEEKMEHESAEELVEEDTVLDLDVPEIKEESMEMLDAVEDQVQDLDYQSDIEEIEQSGLLEVETDPDPDPGKKFWRKIAQKIPKVEPPQKIKGSTLGLF
jgi:hypothetical protein